METSLSLRDNITYIRCCSYRHYLEEYYRISARINENWRTPNEKVEYHNLLTKLERHLKELELLINQGLK